MVSGASAGNRAGGVSRHRHARSTFRRAPSSRQRRPAITPLIDDGRIRVGGGGAAGAERTVAQVVAGGLLQSGKGINLPSASMRTSALTETDRTDLAAGIAMGVDLVAAASVTAGSRGRSRSRWRPRRAGAAHRRQDRQEPQAVERIEQTPTASDGVHGGARRSRRGDLARDRANRAEVAIAAAARRRGVPVILATQGRRTHAHRTPSEPRRGDDVRMPWASASTPSCCRRKQRWMKIRSEPCRSLTPRSGKPRSRQLAPASQCLKARYW